MKDNKYAPYILAPVLFLVWGLVFYKIYQAVYGGEENFVVPNYGNVPVYEGKQEQTSYALLIDYKDPFFGKNVKSGRPRTSTPRPSNNSNSKPKNSNQRNNNQSSKSKNTNPAPIQNEVVHPFPKIVFQGQIIEDNDTIGMLKIDQRYFPMVRKGEIYKNVQILEIYRDSIRVQYREIERTFTK